MSARDDQRWQDARAEYVAEYDAPEEAYRKRIEAACQMREIEREHATRTP